MILKKINIKSFFIICIILLIFISSMPIKVYAKKIDCPICKVEHDMGIIEELEYEKFLEVYTCTLFDDSNSTFGNFSLDKILAFDIKSDGFKGLWSYAKDVYKKILPIGEILAVIYFLLWLMEKTLQDNFNAEQLSRGFIKLAAMILLIRNGFELIEWGMELSTFIYNSLKNMVTFNQTVNATCIFDEINDREWFENLGNFFSLSIPAFLLSIAKLVIRIIAWSRILNLMIRVIFAPIGMADAVKGGTSSQGFRYMKKIIACAIQGSLMLAVMVTYNLIFGLITTTGSAMPGLLSVVLAAVVVTLIFQTGNLANEIMGV